jgi:hypothetical protein
MLNIIPFFTKKSLVWFISFCKRASCLLLLHLECSCAGMPCPTNLLILLFAKLPDKGLSPALRALKGTADMAWHYGSGGLLLKPHHACQLARATCTIDPSSTDAKRTGFACAAIIDRRRRYKLLKNAAGSAVSVKLHAKCRPHPSMG